MDRGRPTRLDTSTNINHNAQPPPTRPKVTVPKAEPVKRKPVPSSVSTASPVAATTGRLPTLSTGGIVVAVADEEPDEHPRPPSPLQEPPSLSRPIPNSPPLIARDLDQWVALFNLDVSADQSSFQIPTRSIPPESASSIHLERILPSELCRE